MNTTDLLAQAPRTSARPAPTAPPGLAPPAHEWAAVAKGAEVFRPLLQWRATATVHQLVTQAATQAHAERLRYAFD